MDYIEKLDLQTDEVEEVETLEKHIITNSEPFSVDEYEGHDRDFLAVGEEYDDGFNQLNKTIGLVKSCIVSKEVEEAREDVNGNIHEKLKDRIDSEVNDIKASLNEKQNKTDNDLNTTSKEITGAINEVNSRIDEANTTINVITGDINEINSKINRDKSHLTTGYETLPSGLILQWGEAQINLDSENTDTTEVTFPKTFPGRAFTVVVSANSNGIINASAYVVQCYDIFQNQFTVRATHSNFTENTGRVSFSWFAIGK